MTPQGLVMILQLNWRCTVHWIQAGFALLNRGCKVLLLPDEEVAQSSPELFVWGKFWASYLFLKGKENGGGLFCDESHQCQTQQETQNPAVKWNQEHLRGQQLSNMGLQADPSFPRKHCDFPGFGQILNDLRFEVCVVNAGLPELPRVAVLLPVVVPVSSAVCSKAEHINLEERRGVRWLMSLTRDKIKMLTLFHLHSDQTELPKSPK